MSRDLSQLSREEVLALGLLWPIRWCEHCGDPMPRKLPSDNQCDCGMTLTEHPDYEPRGPCCAGVVTGGASGCMCKLDKPYAKNH